MTLLLLTLFLKSLVLFALAGAALFALRRSSAAARALVCLLTLTAVLLLPLCSLTLPGWHLPVPVAAQVEPTPLRQEPTPPRPSATLPKREGEEFQASRSPQAAALSPRPPASGGPLRSEEQTQQGGGFLLLYGFGLLLAAFRPLLGLWGIRRLSQTCADIADAPTLTVADDCARLLSLQLPRLCRAGVPMPMTWGWRRPVIALPLASAEWPEDRLRSVLLHEMAHVTRRDWPAHRLADFACAVLWFHPCVWLTARRLRAESELACDDLVLASGIPAPDYARHLLEIASALPRIPTRSHATIAMAQTSHIESRLTMILDKTRTRRTVTRRALLFALVPGTAALVTLAVLRPDAKAHASTEAAATQMVNGISIQLEGVTDGNRSGGRWWHLNGRPLLQDVYNTATFADGTHIDEPQMKKVTFSFRVSKAQDQADIMVQAPGSSATGGCRDADNSRWILTAAYPQSARAALLRVGVASGAWATAASNPSPTLSSGSDHNGQSVIFSSATSAPEGGCNVTITTDNIKQDVRFVAVDKQGQQQVISGSGLGIGSMTQCTLRISFPLSQLKDVRVETRPFQWIEFKDVALQPVQ